MLKVVATGILLGVLMGLPAQAKENSGGGLYYLSGSSLSSFSALNQITDYSALSPFSWQQGGGIYAHASHWVFGLEGQGYFGQTRTKGDSHFMSVSGGSGIVQLGYMAIDESVFQLFPYIGVGLGGFQIRGTEDLSPVLNLRQGKLTLTEVSSQDWIFDLGVGMQTLIQVDSSQGWVLGLKAGYRLTPFDTTWKSNQLPVSGKLSAQPSGAYLNLILGLASFKSL